MISLNTFGALKLKIIEKKIDIGILKAIGLSGFDVKILFLINSISISFVGSLIGNIFGFFIGYNIKNIFFVTEKIVNFVLMYFQIIFEKINPGLIIGEFRIYDESIYYQSSFFVKFTFNELVLINFVIIVMTILSSYIPVIRISKLKPIEIIKSN
jgi:lipoprotein-releasing system permease protein